MNKLIVLYEDNHIIVVIKPVNILSQKDSTNDIDMLTIVKNYIKDKYNKPGNVYVGLVHRLDRPVGGVMVFARTSKAAARLNKQIQDNGMQKSYYAIVHGVLPEKTGTLKDKIQKLDNKKVELNSKNGKEAILNYKVIKELNNNSLLNIDLITGRYHQIRLQFSSRGYPLCGDKLYGNDNITELALFAYKLSFVHPTTKEQMTFTYYPQSKVWEAFKDCFTQS